MSSLSPQEIKQQSERAYGQWCVQWREHAKIHSKYEMKLLSDFEYTGIGKAVLCVANGYSFEQELQAILDNKDNVDIVACDKSLGHLLKHGIKPKFCVVADANVSFDQYLEKYADQLSETILIANVCANPKWSEANWKDRYFFVVMDILESEKEFSKLSGCQNVVAAGTNVSNALVIILTQCDNGGRKNFFGYDKILLIGFDYSWNANGNYYAFNKDGDGKAHYMRHAYLYNIARDLTYSSSNLIFSAKWLDQYIRTFKLPVVQCTKNTILATERSGVLSQQMKYDYKKEDAKTVKDLFEMRKDLIAKKKTIESALGRLAKDHHYAYIEST